MSLLGWLGASPNHAIRSLSPVQSPAHSKPARTVLGVLGTRSKVTDLEAQVLQPLLDLWGIPDAILVPADGDSSYAIQHWAQSKGISTQLLACDWAKHGKRAGLFRDALIQREASHLLLLQGPRSNALSNLAKRLGRKGRPVALSERPGETIQIPSNKSVGTK